MSEKKDYFGQKSTPLSENRLLFMITDFRDKNCHKSRKIVLEYLTIDSVHRHNGNKVVQLEKEPSGHSQLYKPIPFVSILTFYDVLGKLRLRPKSPRALN